MNSKLTSRPVWHVALVANRANVCFRLACPTACSHCGRILLWNATPALLLLSSGPRRTPRTRMLTLHVVGTRLPRREKSAGVDCGGGGDGDDATGGMKQASCDLVPFTFSPSLSHSSDTMSMARCMSALNQRFSAPPSFTTSIGDPICKMWISSAYTFVSGVQIS